MHRNFFPFSQPFYFLFSAFFLIAINELNWNNRNVWMDISNCRLFFIFIPRIRALQTLILSVLFLLSVSPYNLAHFLQVRASFWRNTFRASSIAYFSFRVYSSNGIRRLWQWDHRRMVLRNRHFTKNNRRTASWPASHSQIRELNLWTHLANRRRISNEPYTFKLIRITTNAYKFRLNNNNMYICLGMWMKLFFPINWRHRRYSHTSLHTATQTHSSIESRLNLFRAWVEVAAKWTKGHGASEWDRQPARWMYVLKCRDFEPWFAHRSQNEPHRLTNKNPENQKVATKKCRKEKRTRNIVISCDCERANRMWIVFRIKFQFVNALGVDMYAVCVCTLPVGKNLYHLE